MQMWPRRSPELLLHLSSVKTVKLWQPSAHPRGGGSAVQKACGRRLHLKKISGAKWAPRQTSQRVGPQEPTGPLPLETGLRVILGYSWAMGRSAQPKRDRGTWERNLPGAEDQSLAFPRESVSQRVRERQAAVWPWLHLGCPRKPGRRTPVPGLKAVTGSSHQATSSCSRLLREAEDAPQRGHAWMEARTHPPSSWGLELWGQCLPLGAVLGRS